MPKKLDTVVIFGGSGFIGSHFTAHVLAENPAALVHVVDLVKPASVDPRVTFHCMDVRGRLAGALPRQADVVVNLAAIHREPGHAPREYFETNVLGAQNVCRYADDISCEALIFTSSISVYGPVEDPCDERSMPVPTSAYGASKLVAESVHRGWQQKNPVRRLVIVRPGVVFGPGERGNVSRLVRSVVRGYFFFLNNHDVRKASGYVMELCSSLTWALNRKGEGVFLYNFALTPCPTLAEFVEFIAEVAQVRRRRISVPFAPVLAASHVTHWAASVLGVETPFHPVRAQKLTKSTNIVATVLGEEGYVPRYTLREALAEWKRAAPDEWH